MIDIQPSRLDFSDEEYDCVVALRILEYHAATGDSARFNQAKPVFDLALRNLTALTGEINARKFSRSYNAVYQILCQSLA